MANVKPIHIPLARVSQETAFKVSETEKAEKKKRYQWREMNELLQTNNTFH